MNKLRTITAFIVCFCFLSGQAGFAQTAISVDLSGGFFHAGSAGKPELFRPRHLRALTFDATAGAMDFSLDPGTADQTSLFNGDNARSLLQYFMTGLALPNTAFWVNLRPDSPDKMIDPGLARTELGKVMLAADLQLKKDIAAFTSPATAVGKAYWKRLYKKAEELFGSSNVVIPTLTRPWIVPGEILLRESGSAVYIYKARLKVMLESDYLENSAEYDLSDSRRKELNDYSGRLIRELIIPGLTAAVNTSKKYAELRQVYFSLILAQWFKQRFNGRPGTYPGMIDSGRLEGLVSGTPWEPKSYFEAYLTSFKNGEYDVRETVRTSGAREVRRYFSGGLMLAAAIPAAGSAANGVTVIRADAAKNFDDGLVQIDGFGFPPGRDGEAGAAPRQDARKDGGMAGLIPSGAFNAARRFNELSAARERESLFMAARNQWLAAQAFDQPLNQYKDFVGGIGRYMEEKIGARLGPVHYYPMGGFDVKPFWLSPAIRDVVCVDRQRFGTPEDLSVFLADATFGDIFYNRPFEPEYEIDTRRERYGLTGMGASALVRIKYYLNGEVSGIHYFSFDRATGQMKFANNREEARDCLNTVIEFRDSGSRLRRYWHISENLNALSPGFRMFLADGMSFQSLQLSGAYEVFSDNEERVERKRAIEAIIMPAKEQQKRQGRKVLVLTDRSARGTNYDIWDQQPFLKSLENMQAFGYSSALTEEESVRSSSVVFGSADMLLDGGSQPALFEASITWNSDKRFVIPERTRDKIQRIVTWEHPIRTGKGRSGIYLLAKPLVFELPGGEKVTVKAIKIKGMGDFNDLKNPQPPVAEYYERIFDFMPFVDENMRLITIDVDATPRGGMGYLRAKNEYDVLNEIVGTQGISVNIPLGYGEYAGMEFRGDKMGFVIEGLAREGDERFGDILNDFQVATDHEAKSQTFFLGESLRGWLHKRMGEGISMQALGESVGRAYFDWGKALRSLNDKGILHLRTHSDNWSIDGRGRVVVSDFDSAVHVSDYKPGVGFMLQLYPELASVVRDIHHDVFRFPLVALAVRGGCNPHKEFLEGYFGRDFFAGDQNLQALTELLETADKLEIPPEAYPQLRFDVTQMSAFYLLEPLAALLEFVPPYSWEELQTELERYGESFIRLNREMAAKKSAPSSNERPGVVSRLSSVFKRKSGGDPTGTAVRRDGGKIPKELTAEVKAILKHDIFETLEIMDRDFDSGDPVSDLAKSIPVLASTRDFQLRGAARGVVTSASENVARLGDKNPFTDPNLRLLERQLRAGNLANMDSLQFGDLIFVLSAFFKHGKDAGLRSIARSIGERLEKEPALNNKEREQLGEFLRSTGSAAAHRDGGAAMDRADAIAVREGHYFAGKVEEHRYLKSYKLYSCAAVAFRDPIAGVSGLAHLSIGLNVEQSVRAIRDDLVAMGADPDRMEIALVAAGLRDGPEWQLIRDIREAVARAGMGPLNEDLIDLAPGEKFFNVIFDGQEGTYGLIKDAIPGGYAAAETAVKDLLAFRGGAAARQSPMGGLSRDGGTSNPGGIDFRGVPIRLAGKDPARIIADLSRKGEGIDTRAEWVKIQNMVNRGVIPSCQRIAEYAGACYREGNLAARSSELLSCVARILRFEEDGDIPTEPVLEELLVLLESS